jgi:hypothetical protein
MQQMALPASLEQFIGSERLALLREVALVPLDLADVIPTVRPGDDVVVLVHGFLATAGVFRPLRARLERETGARVATFTHAPGVGVRRIARRLAELVDRMPKSSRVSVVGHSLGGVVARYYVQELGGHTRVAHTVSLASPFGGMSVPPLFVGADVQAQSELLVRLRCRARDCGVPHLSIIAAGDTLVTGAASASLGFGDIVVLPDCGHNSLLFSDRAASIVIDRVKTRL